MTSTTHRALAAALLASAALACDAPTVAPGLDNCVSFDGGACVLAVPNGVISGDVVYSGVRRGDVILLLFAANNLPPPDGTATTALSVARLPSAMLFAGGVGAGPFSAPFLFPNVKPGSYQLRGFLDVTGDFDPFADFTVSPRAGAPTGGSIQLDASGNASLRSFNVPANTAVKVNVVLGLEVPFDPPAFKLDDTASTTFPANLDRAAPLSLVSLNPNVPRATFANPKFAIELKRDADGKAAVSDGDGLVDVFPQIILKQLDAFQPDGSTKLVASADAAIVPCKAQATGLLPLLLASTAGQVPFGVDKITALIQPLAVKLSSSGAATPLPSIPPGHYQVVVFGKSGQAWFVPNSLGTQDPLDPTGKYYVPSQGRRITFAAPVSPGGSISGKVRYPAGRTPGNLILQAYRGGAAFAPPLAALPPSRVKIVPAQFLNLSSDRTYTYTLDALPPGTYVVEALDDEDGNFNSLNLLQTPTKGDLIGGVLDSSTGHLKVIDVQGPVSGQDVTLVGAPGQDGQGNGTPLDPPAFELDETAGPAQIAQDARGTVRLNVRAKPVAFPIGITSGATSAQTTFFTVGLVRDSGGNLVDSDGDGLPDVWPRALLVKLADGDPGNLTQDLPTTAIPVAVDPTPFLPALLSSSNKELVLPATKLSLIVRPAAVDATDPSSPKRLPAMPAGKYKLVLLNKTGQLWQLPNEAGPAALDPRVVQCTTSCGPGQVNTASQGRYFSVIPPAAPLPTGEIDGTLTIAWSSAPPSIASAVVFAWHAEDPPPPFGTSSKPASADLHSAAEFPASTSGGAGSRTVNFALRGLAAGDYFVTTIIDTRGDLALDPQLWGAAPGPGALGGGAITQTGALNRITVGTSAVAGVAAVASADRPLPARPSFAVSSGGLPVASDLTTLFPDAVTPQRITLHAGGKLDGAWGPVMDANADPFKPESGASSLNVSYRGACNAAIPTQGGDTDFDNLPDLWPRVLVVKLADSDATGLTQDPVTTLVPAAVDPTRFLTALGACNATTPASVNTTEVDVLLSPVAVQPQANGTLKQLPIPAGRFGIVLMAKTGQVWRLPNELGPASLDPRAAATSAGQQLAPQGVAIRVASQVPAPLAGGVTGAVKLQNYSAADVGNLIIAVYSALAPPPPLGLGRPVAVQLVPKPYVQLAAGGQQAYFVGNLPAGAYLVAALLDPLGQLSTSLGFLATPPRGAQLSFYTGGGASPAPVIVGGALVASVDVTLDKTATPALPFDRPAFKVDTSTSAVSVSASATSGTAAVLRLVPVLPDGLPYAPVSTAFHPILAKDSSGAPYRDATSAGCNGTATRPWVSSQLYASPIDTGQKYVAYVKVDQCQFCPSLTGTADCSAAPLTPPAGPLPFAGPLVAAVLNVAIDPATKLPAGVPLPQGHYALTLVEPTGLLWTLPNDLARTGGVSGAEQGFAFTVTP